MFLGKLAPCSRLAVKSVCWGQLLESSSRLIAMAPTFKQCSTGTTSAFSMKPFGKFVFDGPGDVSVAPLSPQEYPDMDRCTANCTGDETNWNVTAEGDTYSISSESKEECADSWDVRLPIKYDVEVRSAMSAAVSAMECSRASVTARGDVTLTAVRAGHLAVRAGATLRVNRLLLGNVSLEAKDVDSSGARLQGQTVVVSAQNSCHLSDIYADNVQLEVRSGDLRVGTVHADATVTAAGDGEVIIGGVDGSLQLRAPSASVRCHINRLSSDSRLGGGSPSVQLSLSPGVGCRLEVRGPPARLDPRLGVAGRTPDGHLLVTVAGGGPHLLLDSPQPAHVWLQEWAPAVAGWS